MTYVGNTYTEFKSPLWQIDFFPFFQDGQGTENYLYATYYDTLASAVYSAQERAIQISALLSGSYAFVSSFYQFPVDLTINPTGGWMTLVGDAPVRASGSIATEYFYGKATYDSYSARYTSWGIGQRDYPRNNPAAPILLNGNPRNGTSLAISNGYNHINMPLSDTPWQPRGQWFGDSDLNRVGLSRTVIASGRGAVWAIQNYNNQQLYIDPPPSVSGTYATSYTNAGVGALFVGCCFWVPPGVHYLVGDPTPNYPAYMCVPQNGEYFAAALVIGPAASGAYLGDANSGGWDSTDPQTGPQ